MNPKANLYANQQADQYWFFITFTMMMLLPSPSLKIVQKYNLLKRGKQTGPHPPQHYF